MKQNKEGYKPSIEKEENDVTSDSNSNQEPVVSHPCTSSNAIEQRSLIDIVYRSSYGAGHKAVYSTISKTEHEALNKFWEGRNKESFDVVNVIIRETFQVFLNKEQGDESSVSCPECGSSLRNQNGYIWCNNKKCNSIYEKVK